MTNIIAPLPRKDVLPPMRMNLPQLVPSPGPVRPAIKSNQPFALRDGLNRPPSALQTVLEHEEMSLDEISTPRTFASESDDAYAELFEIFCAVARRSATAVVAPAAGAYHDKTVAEQMVPSAALRCRRKSSVPYLFPHAGIGHLEGEGIDSDVAAEGAVLDISPSPTATVFEPPRLSKTPAPTVPTKNPLQVNTAVSKELSALTLQKLTLDERDKMFDFDKVSSPVSRTRNPVPHNVTFVRPIVETDESSYYFPSLRRTAPTSGTTAASSDLLGLLSPSPSPLCRPQPVSAGTAGGASISLAAVEQFVKTRRVRSRSMSAASDRHGPFLVY